MYNHKILFENHVFQVSSRHQGRLNPRYMKAEISSPHLVSCLLHWMWKLPQIIISPAQTQCWTCLIKIHEKLEPNFSAQYSFIFEAQVTWVKASLPIIKRLWLSYSGPAAFGCMSHRYKQVSLVWSWNGRGRGREIRRQLHFTLSLEQLLHKGSQLCILNLCSVLSQGCTWRGILDSS